MNIIVFASGSGTNFEAIIKATQNRIIKGFVSLLICNKPDANCIKIAEENDIPVLVKPYQKKEQTRDEYYKDILIEIEKYKADLIVLAGWMLIVTPTFITTCKDNEINLINLHPALPGHFPGINAIERAFEAYQNNEIKETGLMVHHVVPEIDAGKVLCQEIVPIFGNDTIDSFKNRMQYFEKPLLIKAINTILKQNENIINMTNIYTGKVSNVYEITHNNQKQPYLAIYHTDRLSAFNRNLCEIPDKGRISTLLTTRWEELIGKEIKNAFIRSHQNTIGYYKCEPIKLEIIVRGYISGSLWRQYEKGERKIYGIDFPDGLVKYQRLNEPIITPTLKSETDDPITVEELLNQNIVTKEEWAKIEDMALKLYTIGYIYCDEHGLILADTKYEFGYGPDNDIWLMDEIHTFDTSRFWLKETYQNNMEKELKPESLDKDFIRDWILENNSYELPDEMKEKLRQIYIRVGSMLMPGFNEDYLMDEKLLLSESTSEMEEVANCVFKFIYFNISTYNGQKILKGTY
jgi:phosphoribosylaminoimidazole-succinocarboxamide synthase